MRPAGEAAAKACCEQASAEGIIAGLTSPLRAPPAAADTDATLPVVMNGLCAATGEVLLYLVSCTVTAVQVESSELAVLVSESSTVSGVLLAVTLARQVTEAGTAEAVQACSIRAARVWSVYIA